MHAMLHAIIGAALTLACAAQAQAQARTICKRALVPDGVVIVAETAAPGCFGAPPNAWVITPADAPEMTVCAVSTVPATHMTVANNLYLAQCPPPRASAYNAIVIRIPWEQEVVCRDNAIDTDLFRIIRDETTYDCAASGPRDNAYYIERRAPLRGFCVGRSEDAGNNAWLLRYDQDERGVTCAQALAATLHERGAQRITVLYGDYRYDRGVEVGLECRVHPAVVFVSGNGRRGFNRAETEIANRGMSACLLRPRNFQYETLQQ